jgi:hypothetical protein
MTVSIEHRRKDDWQGKTGVHGEIVFVHATLSAINLTCTTIEFHWVFQSEDFTAKSIPLQSKIPEWCKCHDQRNQTCYLTFVVYICTFSFEETDDLCLGLGGPVTITGLSLPKRLESFNSFVEASVQL